MYSRAAKSLLVERELMATITMALLLVNIMYLSCDAERLPFRSC